MLRGHTWRRVGAGLGSLSLAATLAGCGGSSGTPEINLYGATSSIGFDKIIAACNQQAHGRYRIVGNLLPSDADAQREQLVRRLAAHDDTMDLMGTDVTWTAEFARAGWIRQLKGSQAARARKDVLGPALRSAEYQGKLYGIPKHTNVQLMWYRKSLTRKPPTTWQGYLDAAKKLKAQGKPHVIAMTMRQYEGYVVVFNTILASLGGSLLNEAGTAPQIDAKTIEALRIVKQFATSGLASPSLSVSDEPAVFAQIQNSEAAFAMNWPYTYGSMKEANPKVYKDLAWTTLPSFKKGIPGRATLGGMNFTISSYSKHPDEAYEAAMCMRSAKHQLEFAEAGNEPPVLKSLYRNPKLQKAYPEYQEILDELKTAVNRPVTPLYQNVSTIVSTTLSPPGSIDPKSTAEELKSSIQDALDGKGILP